MTPDKPPPSMTTYPISFLEDKASPDFSRKSCSRRCWFALLGCLPLAFFFMVVIIIELGTATTTNSTEQPTKWYSPVPAASGYVFHPGRSNFRAPLDSSYVNVCSDNFLFIVSLLAFESYVPKTVHFKSFVTAAFHWSASADRAFPPASTQANNQWKIRPTLDQTTNRGTEVDADSMFEHLGYFSHPLTSSLGDLFAGSETADRNENQKYAVNTPSFGNTRLSRSKRTLKRHWSTDAGVDTTSSRVQRQLLSEFIRILGNLIYQAVKAEQMNISVLGNQDLKQVDLESLSTSLKHKLTAYIFDELDLNRDELIDFREVEIFLQFYELLP